MGLLKARTSQNFILEQKISYKYICVIDLDEVIEGGISYKFIYLKQTLDKNNDKFFAISVKLNHIIMIY